jgi:hypothetical protein
MIEDEHRTESIAVVYRTHRSECVNVPNLLHSNVGTRSALKMAHGNSSSSRNHMVTSYLQRCTKRRKERPDDVNSTKVVQSKLIAALLPFMRKKNSKKMHFGQCTVWHQNVRRVCCMTTMHSARRAYFVDKEISKPSSVSRRQAI